MYEKLKTLLINHIGVDAAEISPDSTFEQLELDSLALAEIAVVLEDQIGVKLPARLPLTLESTLSEAANVFQQVVDGKLPAVV